MYCEEHHAVAEIGYEKELNGVVSPLLFFC